MSGSLGRVPCDDAAGVPADCGATGGLDRAHASRGLPFVAVGAGGHSTSNTSVPSNCANSEYFLI